MAITLDLMHLREAMFEVVIISLSPKAYDKLFDLFLVGNQYLVVQFEL